MGQSRRYGRCTTKSFIVNIVDILPVWLYEKIFKKHLEVLRQANNLHIAANKKLVQKQEELSDKLRECNKILQLPNIAHQIENCMVKRAYRTMDEALYHSMYLSTIGYTQRAYKCSVCPNYHLSHSPTGPKLIQNPDKSMDDNKLHATIKEILDLKNKQHENVDG